MTPPLDVRVLADRMYSEQARQVLVDLPEALLSLAQDGRVVFLNRQAERLLSFSAEEAGGRHWSRVMRLLGVEESAGGELRNLPAAASSDGPDPDLPHYQLVRPDGTRRIVQINRIDHAGGRRSAGGSTVMLRDCTRVYQRLRQLELLSAHDHLTNLVNRRELEQRLDAVLRRAREDGSHHSLLFMDLDRFKEVNDRHGHSTGDGVLKEVAQLLRSAVRDRDTLARLGGDELGLLMEHCRAAQARRTANTLRRLLQRQRFVCSTEPLELAVSIGMVEIGPQTPDLKAVWHQADAACYRAKREGGDGVSGSIGPTPLRPARGGGSNSLDGTFAQGPWIPGKVGIQKPTGDGTGRPGTAAMTESTRWAPIDSRSND